MISEFFDNGGASAHDQFQAWRRNHQDGAFLNLVSQTRAYLHGARCPHLGSGPPYFLLGDGFGSLTIKRKVCGSEAELLAWMTQNAVTVKRCFDCVRDELIGEGQPQELTEETTPSEEVPSGSAYGEEMNDEEFGTADDYLRAFEVIRSEGFANNHLSLLRAHFAAPEHTATWGQLAATVGYTHGKAVNLQYGILAARVAELLGVDQPPKGFWLYVLAGWADEPEPVSGHTAFVLRRPVIEALTRLGVIPGKPIELLPDELHASPPVREGARYQVLVNAYERNPQARRRCIEVYGTSCCICGFSFGKVYGTEAQDYIHVHHLRPLSEVGGECPVDPVKDLRPVCPNCHAVLHLGDRCRSIEELSALVERNRAT
jgi:5-methylcytosine-specific restriction enzyme A